MASFVRIIYHMADSAKTMQYKLGIDSNAKTMNGEAFQGLQAAVADGAYQAFTKVATGVLQAAGTITFTGAPANNDTATIANVVFTAKTSGATGNQFNIGGTVTISAANLAAAINASSNLTNIVTATSLAGVVTITSLIPGLMGNGLQLSSALTNTTAAAFAGGSEGLQHSSNNGLPS